MGINEEEIMAVYETYREYVSKEIKQLVDNHCSKCTKKFVLVEKDGEFTIKSRCDDCNYRKATSKHLQDIKTNLEKETIWRRRGT